MLCIIITSTHARFILFFGKGEAIRMDSNRNEFNPNIDEVVERVKTTIKYPMEFPDNLPEIDLQLLKLVDTKISTHHYPMPYMIKEFKIQKDNGVYCLHYTWSVNFEIGTFFWDYRTFEESIKSISPNNPAFGNEVINNILISGVHLIVKVNPTAKITKKGQAEFYLLLCLCVWSKPNRDTKTKSWFLQNKRNLYLV